MGAPVCRKCRYFDQYYTKEIRHFRQTGFGWCRRKKRAVGAEENCEAFSLRERARENNLMLKCCLNDLLTQMTEIREMLEAERGEKTEDEDL